MFEGYGSSVALPASNGQALKKAFIEENLLNLNANGKIGNFILEITKPVHFKGEKLNQTYAVEVINHGLMLDEHMLKADDSGEWFIENIGEPNWEGGSEESFMYELMYNSDSENLNLPEKFMHDLTEELRDLHAHDYGLKYQFYDFAAQYWLTRFITHSLKKAKNEVFEAGLNDPANDIQVNRKNITIQIQTLIFSLEENLNAVNAGLNKPPALDLGLHESPGFEVEVRELTLALRELKNEITETRDDKINSSLAKEALREFVLRLCGSAGSNIGKSVAVATQVALAYCAIDILKELGVPVNDLYQKAYQLITK